MEQVRLKRDIITSKFGIVFPKDTPLNYDKNLLSVKHPTKSVWLRVNDKDFFKI